MIPFEGVPEIARELVPLSGLLVPVAAGLGAGVLPPVVLRYALLSAARALLLADFLAPVSLVEHRRGGKVHPHRTAFCRRTVISADRRVGLLHYPAQAAGGYSGLLSCGSIWTCPICAAKVTERRRADYEAAFAVLRERGYQLLMLTLTLQHEWGEPLVVLRDLLLWGYTRMLTQGKAARAFLARWGIVGRARALEVTVGWHGWHPHLHIVLVVEQGVDITAFQVACAERWTELLAQRGGYASWAHGAHVTLESDVAYIAKLGFEDVGLIRSGGSWTLAAELTKAPSKSGQRTGLSPLGLLAAYLADGYSGDGWSLTGEQAGRLWLEYAAVMKGQEHLVPAGVLREVLGAAGEKTDVELEVEEREVAVLLGYLALADWRLILKADLRGELQDVLGRGDVAELLTFLGGLGICLVLPEGEALGLASNRAGMETRWGLVPTGY